MIMLYIYEPYYFHKAGFNFLNALRVTTQAIARWCDWYEAQLLTPKKGIKDEIKSGMLPIEFEERIKFIDNLILWLTNNSDMANETRLFMDANPIQPEHKFSYYDSAQWNLKLSPDEFLKLQQTWKDNGLPENLFYPAEKALRLLKPLGFVGKFMTSLGFTWQSFELYSPKQWEDQLQKNPDVIKKLSRHVPL